MDIFAKEFVDAMNILKPGFNFSGLNMVERRKRLLKIRIVKLLYLYGQKTNADICRELSISSPTSVSLLNELMLEGLVEKRGRGESSGGRKPDLYVLRDNCIFVLAIELGKYKTEIAIFNNNNENITGTRQFPISIESTDMLDKLHAFSLQVIEDSGIQPKQIIGAGINMPGLVDSRAGINHTYLNFKQGTLKQLLETRFNFPVYIENDAKAKTMAEFRFGLAQNRENVLAVFTGWGIGLGIIQDGRLYKGSSGFAGEFGHIPIVEDGPLCTCGKQGCLETVASGTTLVKLAIQGIQSGKSSMLENFSGQDLDKIEPSDIVEAALRGDQYSINILGEIGINLGKGLSILIQLFNPELIILGGKIADAKQYLTTPIMQALNLYCMPQLLAKTSIKVSELGEKAGILGSVALVMENIFE